ncbi:DNA replication factor C complex subunit Rfc1 [Microbotryomycetes sp. JL221]|nr:DNA replication factor C complex subunit Rfc1 [Microbotryomycetes sp. JL221]
MAKAVETMLLDSSSDDDKLVSTSTSKSKSIKTKTTTTTPSKKRSKQVGLTSSEEDDDVKPKTNSAAKKRKAQAVASSSSSSSSGSEQDIKPVKKRTTVKKTATKTTGGSATKKKATSKLETDDENEDDVTKDRKGKSKAGPPTKKVKTEGATNSEEKPKFKWQPQARTGANPGSKEVPVGEENCLAGLTFVFTGELESLSREAGQELAKRYGGRVTSAPSSKTSYVVIGTDAGPKKLEMIKKHQIKTLTEDQFLQLIGQSPSKTDDPAYQEQKKKEEDKIKKVAKEMTISKDPNVAKSQLWTVKYAPQKFAEICGNKSTVEKLSRWLEAWPKSLASDFKKPGPDAMGAFRAVLISGPPGIGKTTAAHLVAKMHGFDVLELNASDVRSKKLLESAFKSKITDTTLSGYFKNDPNADGDGLGVNKKSLIIMDEVDGMSAGDRGGVGALNALIKKTKVPIIAIANDKGTPKMKPLTFTCYQMVFKRPNVNEIRSRMMSIAFREGIKVDGKVMDQLVEGSQSDIRQIIGMLSTWKLSANAMDFDSSKKLAKMNAKNSLQTPWTLYSKLTAPQSFSNVSGMTLNDKLELYFQDHSALPLFMHENYIKQKPSRSNGLHGNELKLKQLELVSNASEAISDGDLVDRMIHGGDQHWSLMPVHGFFSCVRPAQQVYGQGGGYPQFPSWFGKNSTQTKLQRLLGEIQIHMRMKVSGDRREIRQSYLPTLFNKLVKPLQDRGTDAVPEVIELMDQYYLTREDWESIIELGVGPGYEHEQVMKSIPTQTKSTFTRKYNSSDHPISFYKSNSGPPKRISTGNEKPDLEAVVVDDDDIGDDEELEDDNDESDDPLKDVMVKQKKSKSKSTNHSKIKKLK